MKGFNIFMCFIMGLGAVAFCAIILICVAMLGAFTYGMYQTVGWWVIAVWLGILGIPTFIGWLISRGDDK